MANLRKHSKDSAIGSKGDNDDSESSARKQSRRSVQQKDSPNAKSPVSPIITCHRTSKEHNVTPFPKSETPVKRQSRRSTHLLVSPPPEVTTTPRRRSTRRLSLDLTDNPPVNQTLAIRLRRLSTDLSDNVPSLQTPTKRSRRLSTDLSENPPQVQTPTRRSRRLSTDLTENPPQVETPTRRSRRLSTDLTEIPPQCQTPIRRSRRLSTDLTENPPQIQTPTRRSRRTSTGTSDDIFTQTQTVDKFDDKSQQSKEMPKSTAPEVEVLARRSKLLSSEISSSSVSMVQMPSSTRRSRRLSTDLVDIPEDDQIISEKLESNLDKLQNKRTKVIAADKTGSGTPTRCSRRKSGAGLLESTGEKALFVVEEGEEEKDEECKDTSSTSESLVLQIIEEEEDVEYTKEKHEPLPDDNANDKNVETAAETTLIAGKEEEGDGLHIVSKEQNDDLQIIETEQATKHKTEEDNEIEVLDVKSVPVIAEASLNKENEENVKEIAYARAEKSNQALITVDKIKSTNENVANTVHNVVIASSEDKENSNNTLSSVTDEEAMEHQENQLVTVTEDGKQTVDGISNKNSSNNIMTEHGVVIMKGKPVSGRWWKQDKKRFTSIVKDKGPRSSWAQKMQRKQELRDQLSIKKSMADEKKRKKIELVERQKLNAQRREENARKAEIIQVIKDSRKIKKMKRKQLRFIETRDTSLLKKA